MRNDERLTIFVFLLFSNIFKSFVKDIERSYFVKLCKLRLESQLKPISLCGLDFSQKRFFKELGVQSSRKNHIIWHFGIVMVAIWLGQVLSKTK